VSATVSVSRFDSTPVSVLSTDIDRGVGGDGNGSPAKTTRSFMMHRATNRVECVVGDVSRTGHDGVVYDLDGTLVRLAVDWDAVQADVEGVFRDAGRVPSGTLWDLLERAESDGDDELLDRVTATIERHERAGARESERLPGADDLLETATHVPVAVVSLNAASACRLALDRHDLTDAVSTVVGRDTVPERKPDPRPLLVALERLGVTPGRALFVGDSPRDRECARRAGVDFEGVGGA